MIDIISDAIKNVAKKLFNFINSTGEIKVTKKCDRQGNNYWLVFNPITRSYSYFYSEIEVKMWIEGVYYNY